MRLSLSAVIMCTIAFCQSGIAAEKTEPKRAPAARAQTNNPGEYSCLDAATDGVQPSDHVAGTLNYLCNMDKPFSVTAEQRGGYLVCCVHK